MTSPGLLDEHKVPHPDVLALDLILVVQGRPRHRRAGQEHGLELGDRRQDARAADLDGDRQELRLRALGRELVGHGPAGGLARAAGLPLQGEGVQLHHGPVRGVGEAVAKPVELAYGRPGLVDALGRPEPLDRRQAPRLHPGVVARLRVARGLGRVAGPNAVEDDLEAALRDLARIEQLDRAGGEVARVRIALLPLEVAGRVDPVELGKGHEDLAADLDKLRHGRLRCSLQLPRKPPDRQHVGRHVVALDAVAAGDGAHELALLVGQADREAVDLRLHDVGQVLPSQEPRQARVEFAKLGLGVRVVEALHRLAVPHGRETLGPVVADLRRGRMRPRRLSGVGEFGLEVRQVPLQEVVLVVADLRARLAVVALVMPGHLRAQGGDFLLGFGRGHRGAWCAPRKIPRSRLRRNALQEGGVDSVPGAGSGAVGSPPPGFRRRRTASLRMNSICPFTLRSSSAAQRSISFQRRGSVRSRNAFRSSAIPRVRVVASCEPGRRARRVD